MGRIGGRVFEGMFDGIVVFGDVGSGIVGSGSLVSAIVIPGTELRRY